MMIKKLGSLFAVLTLVSTTYADTTKQRCMQKVELKKQGTHCAADLGLVHPMNGPVSIQGAQRRDTIGMDSITTLLGRKIHKNRPLTLPAMR